MFRTSCEHHGCSTTPRFGIEGSTKAEFCSKHKKTGMVDVRSTRCVFQGCHMRPNYCREGSRKAEFCRDHKTVGMVDVRSARCVSQGCRKRPSYGREGGTKAEFCRDHKTVGTVDVRNARCVSQGCRKRSFYGREGSRKAEVCHDHKMVGMVNVRSNRCACTGCPKYPFYGLEGSKKGEFCSEHKQVGMVDLLHIRCAHQGCGKGASFAKAGSTKREFCAEHKRAGMVNVTCTRCSSNGCPKRPRYAKEGSRKAVFCHDHKMVDMVDIVLRSCAHQGCGKGSSFGSKGGTKREFCFEHKKTGMVNLTRSTCAQQGCLHRALFGREGSSTAEFCGEHKQEGAVKIHSRKGASEGYAKDKACELDAGTKRVVLRDRQRIEDHQGQLGRMPFKPSDAAAGMGEEEGTGIGVEVGDQIALSRTINREISEITDGGPSTLKRRRVVTREERDASQEAREDPAFAEEPSLPPSPLDDSPSATQDSDVPSPGEQPSERNGRTTSQAPRLLTGSRRGIGCVYGLPSDSCVAATTPAQLTHTEGIATTGDGGLGGGGSGVGIKIEGGDAPIAPRTAGAGRGTSTVASQECVLISESSLFTCDDQRMITSLEQEERDGVAEVKHLQDMVAQLEKQVADDLVGMAHAVPEATSFAGEKCVEAIQALSDAIGGVSTTLKDSKRALKVACMDRVALRQQVTELQARVAFTAGKAEAKSNEAWKAKEDFQHRIEALRAELAATSKGWENTRDDLKEIRQERDALQKELEAQMVFAAENACKAAVNSKTLERRIKSVKERLGVKEGPGIGIQAHKKAMADATPPRPEIPSSSLHSIMAGLATMASPMALMGAVAAAQPSAGATASHPPLPAQSSAGATASHPPPPRGGAPAAGAVNDAGGEGRLSDSMGLFELENEEARDEDVRPWEAR